MTNIEEFWYCVSPQENIPIPDGIQNKQDAEFKALKHTIEVFSEKKGDTRDVIQEMILEDSSSISTFRKIIGITDKRLYLDLTYLTNKYDDGQNTRLVPESKTSIKRHTTAFFEGRFNIKSYKYKNTLAKLITDYLCDNGLEDSLNAFKTLTANQLSVIFKNLIVTKELQQRITKYRGHGVEQAFAKIIDSCGLSFIPPRKAIDPMASKDPNIDLSNMRLIAKDSKNDYCHSFDLIVYVASSPRVLIQSLVHTSDPGQYGVAKSNETVTIKAQLNNFNSKLPASEHVFLMGSVDGIGFCENSKDTIDKMLECFDCFFQMNTLFKIPLFLQSKNIIDRIYGISFDVNYFNQTIIEHFEDTLLKPSKVKNMTGADLSSLNIFPAGKATLILK